MKKVAILANSGMWMASHRGELISRLISKGYLIAAIADYTTGDEGVRALGADVHHMPLCRAGTNPAKHAVCLARLTKLLRRLRPDLLHCFGTLGIIHGGLAARAVGVPVVHTLTGQGILGSADRHPILQSVAIRLCRLALRSRAPVMFQNLYDMVIFVEGGLIDENRAVYVPGSGIDVAAFGQPPARPHALRFIHASRMLESKGVREFVEAARIVRAHRPHASFDLYGGTQEDYPFYNPEFIDRRWLQALNKEGIVTWRGFVPRGAVDDALRSPGTAALVNLSGYGEGVPRIELEAAASGLPIITTNMPGCRDVVDHQRSGYLCNGPNVKEVATVMMDLLDFPEKAQAWGRRSHELVAQFDIANVMTKTLEVYDHVLARRPGLVPSYQRSAP